MLQTVYSEAGSENQDNSDSQDDDGSTQVVRANKAYDWKQCEHSAAHKPEPVCSFMGSFNLPGQKSTTETLANSEGWKKVDRDSASALNR